MSDDTVLTIRMSAWRAFNATLDGYVAELADARRQLEDMGDVDAAWEAMHDVYEADVAELRRQLAEAQEVVRAAKFLADQLDEVHNSPKWKAVWSLAYAHGNVYGDGPEYGGELANLKAALSTSEASSAEAQPKPSAAQEEIKELEADLRSAEQSIADLERWMGDYEEDANTWRSRALYAAKVLLDVLEYEDIMATDEECDEAFNRLPEWVQERLEK
jgi:chromosome segregation ATPase